MDIFTNSISVIFCARPRGEQVGEDAPLFFDGALTCGGERAHRLERWAKIVAHAVQGGYSIQFGVGGWENETELNFEFAVWGADGKKIHQLFRVAKWMQRIESQTAVSVIWRGAPYGFRAWVVYTQEEWKQLEELLAVTEAEAV